jgi:hypothetical protein
MLSYFFPENFTHSIKGEHLRIHFPGPRMYGVECGFVVMDCFRPETGKAEHGFEGTVPQDFTEQNPI